MIVAKGIVTPKLNGELVGIVLPGNKLKIGQPTFLPSSTPGEMTLMSHRGLGPRNVLIVRMDMLPTQMNHWAILVVIAF